MFAHLIFRQILFKVSYANLLLVNSLTLRFDIFLSLCPGEYTLVVLNEGLLLFKLFLYLVFLCLGTLNLLVFSN